MRLAFHVHMHFIYRVEGAVVDCKGCADIDIHFVAMFSVVSINVVTNVDNCIPNVF